MAQRIEAAMLLALPRARLLRVQWPGAVASDGAGMLALDRDGLVVGADRAARQMLALQWQAQARHFGPLDACFATPTERLLGLRPDAPAEAVPLWSGLKAWVAAVGHADGRATTMRWRHTAAQLVREAIDAAQGNVGRAAQQLGVSRATMYRRLARLRRR
jgi:transcriptional regulator of acetoin/glycerol metabolism